MAIVPVLATFALAGAVAESAAALVVRAEASRLRSIGNGFGESERSALQRPSRSRASRGRAAVPEVGERPRGPHWRYSRVQCQIPKNHVLSQRAVPG